MSYMTCVSDKQTHTFKIRRLGGMVQAGNTITKEANAEGPLLGKVVEVEESLIRLLF